MDWFESLSFIKTIIFSFIACLLSPYSRDHKLNMKQVWNLTIFQFMAYGGLYYSSDLIFVNGLFTSSSVDNNFPQLVSSPFFGPFFTIIVPLFFLYVSKYATKVLIAREGRIAMDNVLRRHKMDPTIVEEKFKTQEINFLMTPMLEAILYFLLWGVISIIYASLIAYSDVLKA
jgi:hypothetical protein